MASGNVFSSKHKEEEKQNNNEDKGNQIKSKTITEVVVKEKGKKIYGGRPLSKTYRNWKPRIKDGNIS